MLVLDILLQLLLRLLNDFDLGGRTGEAARVWTKNYVQDRWNKRVTRLAARMVKEGITRDYVTDTRPTPPAGYVGYILGRLWAVVLKGGLIVDAFRDAQEPKITPLVAAALTDDHEANIKAVIREAIRLTF